MKVTITAHCAFCARKFNAVDPVNGIVCDDTDGVLCCDDCLCSNCGRGHATGADYDHCELGDAFGVDSFDPDAFRDRVRADCAGAL